MHGEEDHPGGRTHTGEAQYSSRFRISYDQGPLGLETEPWDLFQNPSKVWPTKNRPIYIWDLHATSPVLQLEAGPPSGSNRRLPSDLGGEELCQPPVGPYPSCSVASQNSTGRSDFGSTTTEVPSMVPSPPLNPKGVPMSDTPPGVNNPSSADNTTSHQGSGGPTGRMAYLRKSCESGSLSKKATKLLLASWRTGSQTSYNLLFHKWKCWCNQRDRNPIQGPIHVADIVNFLAELFESGYSYRSLKAYRSATCISSVHDRVEGFQIGQHHMVVRILKGAFSNRPPKPQYTSIWQVSKVVT